MQLALIVIVALVGLVAAEQPQEVQPVVPGQVGSGVQVEAAPAPVTVHHHNGQAFPGEHHTHEHHEAVHHHLVGAEPTVAHHQQHHNHVEGDVHPAHYSPSGLIQVVNAADKPQQAQVVRQQYASPVAEQYGQPESQALPPNYKPFGSWGLYIGGNPADGYYTNYYKALGNSVAGEKPQLVDQQAGVSQIRAVSPSASSGISQASGFAPILKQQATTGQSYQSYNQDQMYPFTDYYTPADLNSGPSVYAASPLMINSAQQQRAVMSPAQAGAQVYGVSYNSEPFAYSPESYAATKRLGSQSQIKSSEQQQVQTQLPIKGQHHQQQMHHNPMGFAAYAPVAEHRQQQQQQQVVAYPVPVGSQIVGSQPGLEGSFSPYGVHGYTRYAVKPTVVASEQSYYQHAPSQMAHYPIYKQQQQYQQSTFAHHQAPVYQPLGFYGYPLSQLHYSQGSIVPQQSSAAAAGIPEVHQHQHQHQGHQEHQGHAPVLASGQIEAASSDKNESQVNKQQQQKKA